MSQQLEDHRVYQHQLAFYTYFHPALFTRFSKTFVENREIVVSSRPARRNYYPCNAVLARVLDMAMCPRLCLCHNDL